MASYIVECTVSEVTVNNGRCEFKIKGTDGYALKRDKEKYTVLCATQPELNVTVTSACILYTERIFHTSKENNFLLASALSNGKKVKLLVEASDKDIKDGTASLLASSITLLAN